MWDDHDAHMLWLDRYRNVWIEVTKPNLLNHTYQTKPTKPNLPNQTYQTKPTKPKLPNLAKQAYWTKHTKPYPPNQIKTYWLKQSMPGSVVPLAMF